MEVSMSLGAKHVCYWPWVCCSAALFLGEGGTSATIDSNGRHGIASYGAHIIVGPLQV
jgi:hypothetical protein